MSDKKQKTPAKPKVVRKPDPSVATYQGTSTIEDITYAHIVDADGYEHYVRMSRIGNIQFDKKAHYRKPVDVTIMTSTATYEGFVLTRGNATQLDKDFNKWDAEQKATQNKSEPVTAPELTQNTGEPNYHGLDKTNLPGRIRFFTGKQYLALNLDDIKSLDTPRVPGASVSLVRILTRASDGKGGYEFSLPVADADKAQEDWDAYRVTFPPDAPVLGDQRFNAGAMRGFVPDAIPVTIYADYHGVGVSLESNSMLSSQQSLLFGEFGEGEFAYLCGHIDCVLNTTNPKTRNSSEVFIQFKEQWRLDGLIEIPPVTISLPTEGTAKRIVADFKAWQERQVVKPKYAYKGATAKLDATAKSVTPIQLIMENIDLTEKAGRPICDYIQIANIRDIKDGSSNHRTSERLMLITYINANETGIYPMCCDDARKLLDDWRAYVNSKPVQSAPAEPPSRIPRPTPWAVLQTHEHKPDMVKCYCTKCGGVIMCDKAITMLGQIVHVQHDVCPGHTITPSGFALKGRPITPPEGSYVATPFAVKYHGVKLYQDLEKEARDNA